jgi:hypothetical protein
LASTPFSGSGQLSSKVSAKPQHNREAAFNGEAEKPLHFKVLEGQVGQESNLQPAVLEPAAVRSATFREVHEPAESGPFCWPKVSGSSPEFTGVGVKIGVKRLQQSILYSHESMSEASVSNRALSWHMDNFKEAHQSN